MRLILFFIVIFNLSFAQKAFTFNEINAIKDPELKVSLKKQEKTVNSILEILAIGDEARKLKKAGLPERFLYYHLEILLKIKF
jgi:hypothetical protein